MERDGNDYVGLAAPEEFSASARHQAPERLAERNLAAVFEFLHGLAQWMLLRLLARITSPRPSLRELRRPRQTDAAGMIVAAGVGKRPATNVAHRMAHKAYFVPATGAKILRVAATERLRARAAARRIESVDEPVKSFRNRWPYSEHHDVICLVKNGCIS